VCAPFSANCLVCRQRQGGCAGQAPLLRQLADTEGRADKFFAKYVIFEIIYNLRRFSKRPFLKRLQSSRFCQHNREKLLKNTDFYDFGYKLSN